MDTTDEERLRRAAQVIAARRRERLRRFLRRLNTPYVEDMIGKTAGNLALRIAQARALLTTRKNY
jgi:hypothetical protein